MVQEGGTVPVEPLWPLAVYVGLVFVVAGGILILSYVFGERGRGTGRNTPYEAGMNPTATARIRYGLHFYPVAIFFILFDVEAVFLYAWAVAFRELSWFGYIEAGLFIVVLLFGLIYVWRLKGLDWSPTRRAIQAERDRP